MRCSTACADVLGLDAEVVDEGEGALKGGMVGVRAWMGARCPGEEAWVQVLKTDGQGGQKCANNV